MTTTTTRRSRVSSDVGEGGRLRCNWAEAVGPVPSSARPDRTDPKDRQPIAAMTRRCTTPVAVWPHSGWLWPPFDWPSFETRTANSTAAIVVAAVVVVVGGAPAVVGSAAVGFSAGGVVATTVSAAFSDRSMPIACAAVVVVVVVAVVVHLLLESTQRLVASICSAVRGGRAAPLAIRAPSLRFVVQPVVVVAVVGRT